MITIIKINLILALIAILTGCAGVGVRFETYRVDERHEQSMTRDTSVIDKMASWWNGKHSKQQPED